ncbi:hypothetical protein IF655_06725 [Streptomyces sp. DSM 110735]|uniref:hypothetical protein n=1 Tax=Streptomyces sp. DSM 110735 TaxID=2775031 RepID=UPI0018F3ABBA|nr:hypothetical protein [Streptomyces sp. DSM 110735]MBJ7902992.1 hypothetical protein [Streptomyces sp. DSM 110735]
MRQLMRAAGFSDLGDPEELADGWRTTEFGESGRRSLTTFVQRTGTPALTVTFLDSDVGFIEGATPDGTPWEALLNRAMAGSYDIPLDHFPLDPAVTNALTWSTTAALTPDEKSLRQTLTGSAIFAEELASAFLTALGIPGTA